MKEQWIQLSATVWVATQHVFSVFSDNDGCWHVLTVTGVTYRVSQTWDIAALIETLREEEEGHD